MSAFHLDLFYLCVSLIFQDLTHFRVRSSWLDHSVINWNCSRPISIHPAALFVRTSSSMLEVNTSSLHNGPFLNCISAFNHIVLSFCSDVPYHNFVAAQAAVTEEFIPFLFFFFDCAFDFSFFISCQRLISTQSPFDNGSVASACISAQHYNHGYLLGFWRHDNAGRTCTVCIVLLRPQYWGCVRLIIKKMVALVPVYWCLEYSSLF